LRERAGVRVVGTQLRLEVLSTIELDDKLRFDAGEVREVAPDRMLTSELVALQLPVAKSVPYLAFSVR
jgi:hypothetical protein